MSEETIDVASLRRLLGVIGGDQEDLTELVDDYNSGAPKLVETMHEAAASSDWVGVYRSAHTLKSNARDMGAQRLSRLCAVLESDVREGSIEDAETRIIEIRKEEIAARELLQKIISHDISGA